MIKFSKLNEGKTFFPDPSVIKKYASFIIPLYIQGELKCDEKLVDEWLEMNKSKEKSKWVNVISDLEILAVKNIISNPVSQNGYDELKMEIRNKCPKLEKFLRTHYQKSDDFE